MVTLLGSYNALVLEIAFLKILTKSTAGIPLVLRARNISVTFDIHINFSFILQSRIVLLLILQLQLVLGTQHHHGNSQG